MELSAYQGMKNIVRTFIEISYKPHLFFFKSVRHFWNRIMIILCANRCYKQPSTQDHSVCNSHHFKMPLLYAVVVKTLFPNGWHAWK